MMDETVGTVAPTVGRPTDSTVGPTDPTEGTIVPAADRPADPTVDSR